MSEEEGAQDHPSDEVWLINSKCLKFQDGQEVIRGYADEEGRSHSNDGSHGDSCCLLFAQFSRNLGSSQNLTMLPLSFFWMTPLQITVKPCLFWMSGRGCASPALL